MTSTVRLAAAVGSIVAIAISMSASARQPAASTIADLIYASVDGSDLRLDLYLPATTGPAPLVVYFHGGGWSSGSRKNYGKLRWQADERTPFAQLVAAGYAVAAVDYRLSSQAQWPAQIFDAKAAVRWLRASAEIYRIDPNHVAAWGDSAGGYVAAMLGTSGDVPELEGSEGSAGYSSRVQAVADWFGPIDLLSIDDQALDDGRRRIHLAEGSGESLLLGCVATACPERARAASPISYVSRDDPPVLLQHGRFDHVVPFGQSVEFRDALNRAGVRTEFHAYDCDHEFEGVDAPPKEIRAALITFLGRTFGR
ncbi:alpha/beta hydrolase [Nocardia sp. NBC_00403]|uniref:alpha/beta hydrolase n=1 Tax=Nocardia sp. NBC_00403 TaxID=2975990 RepID=UPI002E208ECB